MIGSIAINAIFGRHFLFRAFSACKDLLILDPGRCPGLLHFAPLALRPTVFRQSLNRWAPVNRPPRGLGALEREKRRLAFESQGKRTMKRARLLCAVLALVAFTSYPSQSQTKSRPNDP